jgi:copper chaperone CopZ
LATLTIKVDIPCSGHAPLITTELYKLNGIKNVKFTPANQFTVSYDPSVTTKDGILSLGIFKTYPAKDIGGQQ